MFDRHIKPNQYLMMITIENVRQSYYFVYILTKHYQTDKTHVLEIQEHLLFPKNTPRDAACSQRACKFENHPSISTEISLSLCILCALSECVCMLVSSIPYSKDPKAPAPLNFGTNSSPIQLIRLSHCRPPHRGAGRGSQWFGLV
jgi:hypothetical protein